MGGSHLTRVVVAVAVVSSCPCAPWPRVCLWGLSVLILCPPLSGTLDRGQGQPCHGLTVEAHWDTYGSAFCFDEGVDVTGRSTVRG